MSSLQVRTIRAELDRMPVEGEEVSPTAVVEAARSSASPLHRYFEWDDKKAGHQFRLGQARQLIRSVKVEVQSEQLRVGAVKYVGPSTSAEAKALAPRMEVVDRNAARRSLQFDLGRAEMILQSARHLGHGLGLAEQLDTIVRSVQRIKQGLASPVIPDSKVRVGWPQDNGRSWME